MEQSKNIDTTETYQHPFPAGWLILDFNPSRHNGQLLQYISYALWRLVPASHSDDGFTAPKIQLLDQIVQRSQFFIGSPQIFPPRFSIRTLPSKSYEKMSITMEQKSWLKSTYWR